MLKENKHAQFVKAFWDAKTYTPSGVINVSDKREESKVTKIENGENSEISGNENSSN